MGSLNQVQVKNAKAGRHGDGDGLYLLVSSTGAKSWILRVQADGRRRDIGLGAVDTTSRLGSDRTALEDVPILQRRRLTLAEAREKASLLRAVAKTGRDPVTERDKDRKKVPTFKEAAIAAHKALAPGWGEKHADAFLSSLSEHAYPALGDTRVDEIEASHLRDMLAPIWTAIPVMAKKVRQRVGTVLNFAKSKGWRASEAPGKSVTLGLARHTRGGNFAAMPYDEVPAFISDTRGKVATVGRLALMFTILTAARSGEVRHARWSHIDLAKKLWNRPADLMKSGVAHSVTLSDAAVAVLEQAKALRLKADGDPFVFPSTRQTALSDMTLSKIMRDEKLPYTVHGFRSSFRDWAAEKMPHIPDAVAEAALAHAVPDKVIAAYKRTSFLEMRRELLVGWGTFATDKDAILMVVP